MNVYIITIILFIYLSDVVRDDDADQEIQAVNESVGPPDKVPSDQREIVLCLCYTNRGMYSALGGPFVHLIETLLNEKHKSDWSNQIRNETIAFLQNAAHKHSRSNIILMFLNDSQSHKIS